MCIVRKDSKNPALQSCQMDQPQQVREKRKKKGQCQSASIMQQKTNVAHLDPLPTAARSQAMPCTPHTRGCLSCTRWQQDAGYWENYVSYTSTFNV